MRHRGWGSSVLVFPSVLFLFFLFLFPRGEAWRYTTPYHAMKRRNPKRSEFPRTRHGVVYPKALFPFDNIRGCPYSHIQHTFRLPPVMVTLTKRRVYFKRFMARPLGSFFFSCGSTCSWLKRDSISKICPSTAHLLWFHLLSSFENFENFFLLFLFLLPRWQSPQSITHNHPHPHHHPISIKKGEKRNKITHLRSRRPDLTRTGERSVNLTHGCWW